MEIVYCIKCEHEVKLEKFPFGNIHEKPIINDFGCFDMDWCEFPLGFTYSEPPEYDENWEIGLIEPEPEIIDEPLEVELLEILYG